jgi:hypothetical protein
LLVAALAALAIAIYFVDPRAVAVSLARIRQG